MILSTAPTPTPFTVTHRKLAALRHRLQQVGLEGLVIPSADEHLNEYLPKARQRREWLTGFTGSAGDVLVTQDRAWLTVDSRYYEQAEYQVDHADFQIVKLQAPHQPKSLYELIEQELKPNFRLGVDPFTISVANYRELEKRCAIAAATVVPTTVNGIDQVQAEGNATGFPFADQPVYPISSLITGASIAAKLDQVRQSMRQQRIDLLPVTKLDQVAWLFNLRGSDIPYNPVFIAYAVVTLAEVYLFTRQDRLTVEAGQELQQAEVRVLEYDDYPQWLAQKALTAGVVGIDPKHTTQGTLTVIPAHASRDLDHPIEGLKARKNPVELEKMRLANQQASRAKIRTLAWIEGQMADEQPLSEADVAGKIEQFYQEEPDWCGLSFNTISSGGSNTSIVHYSTPDPQRWLQPGELLLIDSGSHYLGGTTDDTRTISLGDPTPLQKQRYTEVLKAHIQCASQRFPVGTLGAQLDGITRSTLWQAGLNFGHGTGHGVGAFLNVHEGPNGIHKQATVALEPGMITSIEPGYYEPGWGGIRLENLCEIQSIPEAEGWLQFQPLTWIPFDRKLVDPSLLTEAQKDWISKYHRQVFAQMSPGLSTAEAIWLQQACGLD
jgi:Xaa-Pro aminopeptidase